MNLNDLWVGDYVKLIKSGRIGRFHASSDNGKIKAKLENDKIVNTTISNIEKMPDDYLPEIPKLTSKRTKPSSKTKPISDTIDLHYEVLFSNQLQTKPERILQLQIGAAKEFIESAIANKLYRIVIIHGKGEGILKSEILHLLTFYDEINYRLEINQGGATEVIFK